MIRPISEGDAWVTNDDGDIIGIQLHGRSETVDLSNPVNGKVDPVTGGVEVSKVVKGKSAAELSATPSADDVALGDSTVFYDLADPTKRYTMNAGHTAFVAIGGSSGGSTLTAAQKFGLKLRSMDRIGKHINGDSMMTATSFPHTASAKSKGQLRVEKRTNTAGYTSAQVLTALQAAGVDSRSDVVLWMEGANDAAGAVTNASHIATFKAIGDYAVAGGKIPFLAVSPPSNVSTTIQGRLEQYAIREILLAEKKGWMCVNPWEMVTITGGAWVSGASDDGIHPTAKIQGQAGEYMWDCVINNRQPKLLPRTNTGAGLSQSNVLNVTNTSGLPAGWAALSFASGSYSLADYAAPFLGKKCSATVSRADGSSGYLTKDIATGSIDGHVVRLTGVMSLDASTNMRVYLNMVFFDGITQLSSKTVAVLTTADGVDNYVNCEGEVPAGTTKVQAQFVCGPNETAGSAWSGTFGFGQIDAYDVTALTA